MNELIYSLLLKTAQGLTLFGSLRFTIDTTQPATPGPAIDAAAAGRGDAGALLAQLQQQQQQQQQQQPIEIELFAYRIDGAVTIPFVTGAGPVPLTGLALFTFLGPPATFFTSSTDPARNLFLQFNGISNDNITGGLVWRAGEPGELIFSVLGTQLQLPA
ncbi:hypothetical protein ASF61_15560 [Duganella sp. Leaf126]|uniref:hypothetical protein n=1 Tax=Duganella sp. Leaf126 TaxID=1736266 RepID=UPI0006FA416D|nr:hypothetical protein [Duganella sp. Leaf126]KQQ32445.1 hypothetical protein ASF61_15560 [Duganella sp. Leaf126]